MKHSMTCEDRSQRTVVDCQINLGRIGMLRVSQIWSLPRRRGYFDGTDADKTNSETAAKLRVLSKARPDLRSPTSQKKRCWGEGLS